MAKDDQIETADEVRAAGNELYKAGKINEAIAKYNRAVELDPTSSAPQSNIAAAHFELGDYPSAIKACDAALELLAPIEAHSASRQKLLLRKCKACVHSLRLAEAREALSLLDQHQERERLERCLRQYESSLETVTDPKELHRKLIFDVPRFKPAIRSVQEYYNIGHDPPEPMMDTEDIRSNPRKKISLLFGGVGDARHLYSTLANLGDSTARVAPEKSFHFTIVDLKPAILAKDLLVMSMLDEMSRLPDVIPMMRSVWPLVLYYTYVAPVVPNFCFNVVQKKICEVIDALEGRSALPSYITVPQLYRAKILEVLKEWQKEAPEAYPTSRVRKRACELRECWADSDQIPRVCKKERAFYRETGILMPSASPGEINNDMKRELANVLKAYRVYNMNRPLVEKSKLLDKVDALWKPNVTMLDLQWLRNQGPIHEDVDVGHNPFQIGHQLQETLFDDPRVEGMVAGLADHVMIWFVNVAGHLKEVKHRIVIEVCHGDILAIMEQIRYGVVGHRQQPQPTDVFESDDSFAQPQSEQDETTRADSRPTPPSQSNRGSNHFSELSEYPKLYDRIHLSNVPDYVGGQLTTFLYALPLLQPGKSSSLTSNCLYNPPCFKTIAHFNCEYLCLSSSEDIEKAFDTRMLPMPMSAAELRDQPLQLTEYYRWARLGKDRDLSKLLSRSALETWLFRLFFKLCLPKERAVETVMIYCPLNLTIFVRLCVHLHSIGYPAHWISGVLEAIISGDVTTKARPPRSNPLKIREVKTEMPVLKQSTAPFAAELSTLVGMWLPVIPFGLTSANLPLSTHIRKYNVRFESEVDFLWPHYKHFVIVFLNTRTLAPAQNIRPNLLGEESLDNAKNIHIISTWTYDESTRTASFWMRQDVMELVQCSDPWSVAVVRTDTWMFQTPPRSVSGRLVDGGFTWAQELQTKT